MADVFTCTKDIAGRPMTIEVGKLALQTNGSCTVRYGDTVVLATAVMAKSQREGLDFFPLMVEYEERLYAGGKIKGSRFIKREGRPSDDAVVSGRMIDRAIRPLFDDRIRNDVQVMVTILSVDNENEADITAMVAASAALAISDIPWAGPIAGLRVGMIDGKLAINPSRAKYEAGALNLVIAGTPERIIMVDCDAKEVAEETMVKAFEFGQEHFKDIINLITEAVRGVGRPKKTLADLIPQESDEVRAAKEALLKTAEAFIADKIRPWLFERETPTKALRKSSLDEIKDALKQRLIEEGANEDLLGYAMDKAGKIIEAQVSAAILEKEQRVDGRSLSAIRALRCEVGLLPRTHGSGLFMRGETQVLSIATLGAPGEEQIIESMEEESKKRYMHHYNFPPFSVGEARPLRTTGRREIGHGMLAEKALLAVLPPKEEFPYTIRVVSEVMGSNGSSSMASTCGSTLALMDAGVPIKKPVAGIAMGLAATDDQKKYKILTDLQDLEDGKGGMDFKIAGTRDGITAIQMDTKTTGLSKAIVRDTVMQARDARMEVLDVMTKALAAPRPELSPYAPRVESFKIDPDKIGAVIGTGGKVINEIIDVTGASIDIEDDGSVFVSCTKPEGLKAAVEWIKNIVKEVEPGEVYTGKVVKILDFGAFVNILPGKEGMIHISKLAPGRVNKVTDILDEGMEVKVQVIEIDSMGRINLKLLEGGKPYVPQPNGDGGGFDRRPPRGDKPQFKKRLFRR